MHIDSFNITTAGTPAIGNILSFTNATISFTNVSFNYGATPTVAGTVTVSVTNGVLFPTVSFLNISLGNLSGSYTFDAPGLLTLNIPSLTIPIGEALTINLGAVSLTPDQTVMATVASATVTANMITGLPSATVTNFQLMRTGFTLKDLTIQLTAPVTIGNFLSIASASITVAGPSGMTANGFSVTISPTASVSGSITAMISGVNLFPNGGVVTSNLSGLGLTYALSTPTSTGKMTVTIGSFDITVANILELKDTGGVTITPDSPTLLTDNSGTLTLTVLPLNNLMLSIAGLP